MFGCFDYCFVENIVIEVMIFFEEEYFIVFVVVV